MNSSIFDMEKFLNLINEKGITYSTIEYVGDFVKFYEERDYLNKELMLFSIVGDYYDTFLTYILESDNYEEKKYICQERINLLKDFLFSLNKNELNKNAYFQIARMAFDFSKVESEKVLELMKDRNKNIIKINYGVTDNSKILFLSHLPYLTIFRYKHPKICDKYNEFVSNIIKLIDDIYFLQLYNVFIENNEDIEINKFIRVLSENENYLLVLFNKLEKNIILKRFN